MIDKILLKFGSSPNQTNLEIDVTPITVFVGPNNSGKSKILFEIENFCRPDINISNNLIVEQINFKTLSNSEILEILDLNDESEITYNHILSHPDIITINKYTPNLDQITSQLLSRQELFTGLDDVKQQTRSFKIVLSLNTLRLDGLNRLSLIPEHPAGDLQNTPNNKLARLFTNNSLRSEVSRIIYDAFEKYFVIDPTNLGKYRVRLSNIKPANEAQERGISDESIAFHKAALSIEYSGDGIKAYCGIISTILAGDPKILLIDEPEAFLHPALASKLGKEIGNFLKDSKKRLFASTHSSSFLMGCIQSASPLNIVRLTYKNEIPSARILPKEKIIPLMQNPLLRSTGVLNSLFYEAVIICEADSDRAFYQEINERLLAKSDPRGINNCLFINAQNKQTIWDIIKPLRELGIPCIGIVDIDFIKDGGQVFTKSLESCHVPELGYTSYQNQRVAIIEAFKGKKNDMKKNGGIALLNREEQQAFNDFISNLNGYGIFIVKNGELESWLKHLGASGHGPSWLKDIFIKMGENPNQKDYLNPSDNDVWEFMGEIKNWISNPLRKGIPD